MKRCLVLFVVAAVAVVAAGTAQATIVVLKSGAGIDSAKGPYNGPGVSNLFADFQPICTAGSNVVQVNCDEYELTNNGAGFNNPNWLNASLAGTSDYGFLMKWDLSSIPTGAHIVSAQVRLTGGANASGNYGGFYVGRITTSNWTQGVVTCNKATPTTSWASQPFGLNDMATPVYTSVPVAAAAVFDVTSDVQAMVNDTVPNYGWGMASSATFSSSSPLCNDNYATDVNSNTALRPALFVEYTPEPMTLALLAMGGLALLRRRA